MTIGERIKLARLNAGLSLQNVGDRLGLSKMAISKYETGAVVPRSGTLIALGKVLGVPTDFFFRSAQVSISPPVYRCRAKLQKREMKRILGAVAEWLERYLAVEQLTGYETPLDLPTGPEYAVRTMEEIETAASRVREAWNLGLDPIENVMDVLEQHGIKIGEIDASVDFDALTLWYDDNCPVIAVNRTFPGDRQRYNLAHELGHLVLVLGSEIDPEKAAHRFAAAFLVPREMAYRELGRKRKNLDYRELHLLKQKYGMSMRAWVYRAADLEIISMPAAQRHWRDMNRRGWRTVEPGEQVPPESPTRMELLLYRALTEQKMSESRFRELLGKGKAKAAEPCA